MYKRRINFEWLDDKGHVKPPMWLYLFLAWAMKAYLVWIASLTYREDTSLLIGLAYPSHSDWQMALASGAGGVLLFGLVLAERRRSPEWLIGLFRNSRWILAALWLGFAALWLQAVDNRDGQFHWSLGLDGIVLLWSLLYGLRSRHLQVYFSDWSKAD
ncbi:DUF2919 domain-containing protein [Paraferrimonas sedimenticola]|uniref:DUF2919 family protein n=1 Tax=Paraferrimonas sedimenticola TaxID=375674 RepID=A0AA37VXY1_9GAMM|nr:DUF2919 domain-containing protein [Paraferrimonas sedimenticola]GLP96684.1 hypothetical protein GCM10007895_19900 [Paraferrimonas sedimenticola]